MSILRVTFASALAGIMALPAAYAKGEPAKAILNRKGKSPKQVFIKKANDKGIFYIDNLKDTTEDAIERRAVESVFFYRPSTFHKGMEQFNSGKFDVAEGLFRNCKELYEPIKKLPGNYSVLAAFYEIECARRGGDLEKMEALLDDFRPDAIVNENHILQLEIYSFWDAVRSKSWDRLNLLAKNWEKKKLPGAKRAQISYCHGLALEGLGKREDALMKFNEAIALSELQESEVVINSCEKIINLILQDDAVKDCQKALGTKDEDKASKAYYQLLEAASVAKLWNSLAIQNKKLPSKHQKLLKLK